MRRDALRAGQPAPDGGLSRAFWARRMRLLKGCKSWRLSVCLSEGLRLSFNWLGSSSPYSNPLGHPICKRVPEASQNALRIINATAVRRIVLEQSRRANVGHIGSSLCVVEILCAIYE